MQKKVHLTLFERERIEYYLRLKMSIREIGRRIGKDHSVVSREISRNIGHEKRYRSVVATKIETERRRRQKGRKIEKDEALRWHVIAQLRTGRSPDVIAGRLRTHPPPELRGKTVSQESIYQYIFSGAGRYENLYRCLRYKRLKRRKRYGRKPRTKTRIPERISIHARSEEVQERKVIGHWESDSMIFSKQKPILSVQVERVSRLVRIHKAPNKTAEETEHAIRKTIESLPAEAFKTMTFDNGTEGANHVVIRNEYDIKTYFCDTYASWQKGTVENTNSIIRRYFPKIKDLSAVTDREVWEIQERINDTPRKCLGYRTANEAAGQFILGVVHY